jgi:polysaccharide pyruvyl transferase WcaK-like protein
MRAKWWIPILPTLVHRLEGLFSLAKDEGFDAVLVPSWFGRQIGSPPPKGLNPDGVRFVKDFLAYRLLEEEVGELSESRRRFYSIMHDALGVDDSGQRTVRPVTILEIDERGLSWQLREESREVPVGADDSLEHSTKSHPSHVAPSRAARAADVAEVLLEGGRGVLAWAATLARDGRTRPRDTDPILPRVLIIGAYGGEHIGDAAILGGVLLRIHQKYQTNHAVLVSQRPDHTAHLVPMLDTPVEIKVEEYRQSTVAELLESVDGLVFAGGPLMDLPKQLVKHLYAVSLARRAGKPFVLEGIGAGPFVRWPSLWTARRLVRMADRISVRTSDDGSAGLMKGLPLVEVGRDPAFDYLASRGSELTRLPETDREWIERLLQDTEGRVIVGINLRPIRPDYTTDTSARRRVEYTRFVEARFEERLAEAMRRFQKASDRPPCFVFFPMNAIQFGLSDLRSAYRLARLLRGDVDFRVWDGDASIDGVVALLRRIDVAITMRFHATIFALSQSRRVIGIDYRVGRRDKVAALLDDAGKQDSHARIDEMTSDWLFRQLMGPRKLPRVIPAQWVASS